MSLVAHGDPILRQRAMPVGRVRKETRAIFDRMIDAMRAACGAGIAAPQIGVPLRLCIVNRSVASAPVFMADPLIIRASANMDSFQEGCLSFPDVLLAVQRHARVTVRYRDYHNELRECTFDDMAAACVQHELDHLDGVTFFARAYQNGMSIQPRFSAGSGALATRVGEPQSDAESTTITRARPVKG